MSSDLVTRTSSIITTRSLTLLMSWKIRIHPSWPLVPTNVSTQSEKNKHNKNNSQKLICLFCHRVGEDSFNEFCFAETSDQLADSTTDYIVPCSTWRGKYEQNATTGPVSRLTDSWHPIDHKIIPDTYSLILTDMFSVNLYKNIFLTFQTKEQHDYCNQKRRHTIYWHFFRLT